MLPILYAILFLETRYLGAGRGGWSPLKRKEQMSIFWSIVSLAFAVAFATAEIGAIAALDGQPHSDTLDDYIYGVLFLFVTAIVIVPIAPQLVLLWNRSPLGRVIRLADMRPRSGDEDE